MPLRIEPTTADRTVLKALASGDRVQERLRSRIALVRLADFMMFEASSEVVLGCWNGSNDGIVDCDGMHT